MLKNIIEKCGCEELTSTTGSLIITKFINCKKHTKEKIIKDKKINEDFQENLKKSVETISCEICDNHICYVQSSDLNCSYFICDKCKNN